MQRILIAVGVTALLVLGAVGLLIWWLRPPDDASMVENLERHRDTFEQLVRMVQQDRGLERVDDTWSEPANTSAIGVSPQRLAEYRRLFELADVPRGFSAYGDGATIEFIARTAGIAVSGWSKSYVYREAPPGSTEELVDGPLDAHHARTKVVVTRHIEGRWYLQYASN